MFDRRDEFVEAERLREIMIGAGSAEARLRGHRRIRADDDDRDRRGRRILVKASEGLLHPARPVPVEPFKPRILARCGAGHVLDDLLGGVLGARAEKRIVAGIEHLLARIAPEIRSIPGSCPRCRGPRR